MESGQNALTASFGTIMVRTSGTHKPTIGVGFDAQENVGSTEKPWPRLNLIHFGVPARFGTGAAACF
jgi:hypothetical protein